MAQVTFVKAWERDPVVYPGALTHAAVQATPRAMCGVTVTVWGGNWLASGAVDSRESRCNICTQGAQASIW